MSWKRPSTLFCVFLTLFYDRLGESVVLPLLAFLVAPLVPERQVGLVVGLLVGSYTVAQFLATPVIGFLSDHFGRRPVLLVCIAGSVIGISLFGIAGSLPLMFVGRILDGATGGTTATAQAVIADITPPDKRAKAFGLVGIAFGLGFVIGPGLGGWLAEFSVRLPILVAVVVALLNLLLTLTLLPETLPEAARQQIPSLRAALNPFRQLARLLLEPGVGALSLGFGLFFLVFNGFTTILVPYLVLSFAWTTSQVGTAFCIVGVLAMVVQGAVIGPLNRRFGERRLTVAGIALVGLGCLMVLLAQPGSTQPVIYTAVAVLAIGTGLVTPSLRAMISRRLDNRSQGRGLGSLQALQSLGSSIGPPLAGALFTWFTPRTPFLLALPALLGVGALTTGALLRQRKQANATSVTN